jgi:hypothetical protein
MLEESEQKMSKWAKMNEEEWQVLEEDGGSETETEKKKAKIEKALEEDFIIMLYSHCSEERKKVEEYITKWIVEEEVKDGANIEKKRT